MIAEFELETPARLDDALALLAGQDAGPGAALAGGTNLIVDLRSGRESPGRVVDLGGIDALRGIEAGADAITLGARTTVSDLLTSPEIAAAAPALVEAARVFAGQMVRNAATVAGNIACGSPAADLVPPLMTLDAEVTLASAKGERAVLLAEYFTGYRADVRRADELITRIRWPRLPERSVHSFYKLARRKGDAITVVGVSVALSVEGGLCARSRIALGAVAPTVVRAPRAETMLEGAVLTPALIEDAARQAAEECAPIDDIRASAAYRRHGVHMLTRRLVTAAWDRLV